MFLLSNKSGCFPNSIVVRAISCSSSCHNFYVTLGLTPAASQAEIKKAYFELCKKYHPDKNDGSVDCVQKFRKISEAYEVLGHEKSRRLYDQKMCYGGAPRNRERNARQPEDYNYEAERFFYERRNISRRYTGKTWFYNFDAWNSAHYPRVRQEEIQAMRRRRGMQKDDSSSSYNQRYQLKFKKYFKIMALLALSFMATALPLMANYDDATLVGSYVKDDTVASAYEFKPKK